MYVAKSAVAGVYTCMSETQDIFIGGEMCIDSLCAPGRGVCVGVADRFSVISVVIAG